MSIKDELSITANNAVYKKLYKIYIANKYGYCNYCPFHRGENAFGRRDVRSWKRYRKTQYKDKLR